MSKPAGRQHGLDAQQIARTIDTLCLRIDDRLPGRGIGKVARRLKAEAEGTAVQIRELDEPNILLGLISILLVAMMAGVLALILFDSDFKTIGGWTRINVINDSIGAVVYLGLAVVFVMTLSSRLKRRRVLEALQELRVLAHVIDMHQLTKSPDRLSKSMVKTAHSPDSDLTPFLLGRYLDYCTEMLSLVGKIAALYAERFPDPAVLEAVDDIEGLTTSMSRKIWQKIMILRREHPGAHDGDRADSTQ